MATSLADYYEARASEYESTYDRPERQFDLRVLRAWLADEVRDRTLLEVACGTGYWTSVAAPAAKSILATDINSGPLAIARAKTLGNNVAFAQADAFALPDFGPAFDGGMALFWWSHVSLSDQQRFLDHFASRLCRGARLVMIDHNFVAGSTPISRTDHLGNTYERRRLRSGDEFEVMKNFPTNADLERTLASVCAKVSTMQLNHFWAVSASLT